MCMATTTSKRVELFINAATGETVERELTNDEMKTLPEPNDDEPKPN